MKEWILYCLLCSLIYALSAQAKNFVQQKKTADVIYWNKAKIGVLDCALFTPNLDPVLGKDTTAELFNSLSIKGYRPIMTFSLKMEQISQADSLGHKVIEFYTDRDFTKLNRNGQDTLYLTLTGVKSTIKKKHKFTIRLHTIGQSNEIAKTVQSGTLGQTLINIRDLPNCQPKDFQ